MNINRAMTASLLSCSLLLLISPNRINAQHRHRERLTRYAVKNLGTLGGTVSAGNSITNIGWATGNANLAGDQTTHATLWARGVKLDLGTFGGANSAVLFPNRNNHGEIVGVSETADVDPLGEAFSCSAFFPSVTHHTCRAFVWRNGTMHRLGTFGGDNSFGSSNNDRGMIVGWAENNIHDPSCVAPQVLQFRAALWDRRGNIRELPPLSGDSDSAATGINNRGQVVGISGICDVAVGRFSAAHAVMWEDGIPHDIGNLGGVAWNTPTSINRNGVVVGFSDLPGDESGAPNFHAFIWDKEHGIRDMGTLPGDAISEATGINDRGQIVGVSFGAGFAHPRAFIWQDGVMTDLNALIPANSSLRLIIGGDINDRGEITGEALDVKTGDAPAFLAVPREDDDDDSDVALAQPISATPHTPNRATNRLAWRPAPKL